MSEVLFLVWFRTGKGVVMRQRTIPMMSTDIEWVMRQFSEVNNNGYVEAYSDDKRVGTYGTRPEE